MKRKNAIQNSPVYQHRYLVAGIILALVAAFMAAYLFWDLPGGLSAAEMRSASIAGNLSLSGLSIGSYNWVNLPWTLLQALSIKLFGLSVMSVSLPAVVVSLLTVGLIILLLKKITKPSLAIMGGLLTVSSSFAISLARAGVPAVMTTLLLTLLFVIGYYAINGANKDKWRSFIGLAIVASLMCYMEAGPYIVLVMLVVALLHPRLRLALLSNKKRFGVMLTIVVIITAPLWLSLIAGISDNMLRGVASGLFSLGSPSLANPKQFVNAYGGFDSVMLNGLVVPMLTVVGAIMTVIGLVVAARDKASSVRFYLLLGMLIFVTILGAFNPGLVYLLFIPTIILETLCLGYFTDKWYGLFPVNPYARVFAIVPLAILLGSLSSVDMSRFFNAVNYNKNVVYAYDWGITAVNDILQSEKDKDYRYTIVTTSYQSRFYQVLAKQYDDMKVVVCDDNTYNVKFDNKVCNSKELTREVANWANDKTDKDRLLIIGEQEFDLPKDVHLSTIRTNWWSKDNVVVEAYK